MTSEPSYYVTVEGGERGPYALSVLRGIWKRGLLASDVRCRVSDSNVMVPVAQVLGVDMLPSRANPATAEFEVQYQSFMVPARNSLRFSGKGTAQVKGGELLLTGKRSRPFWFSRQADVVVPLQRIRDVRLKGKMLSFDIEPEVERKRSVPQPMNLFLRDESEAPMNLFLRDESEAQALAAALPARLSPQAAEHAAFETKLGRGIAGAPVTIVLLAANFGIYAAFALMGGGFMNADPQTLIRWGSNFGPYTSDGQWWRLLGAAFLHGGLIHLLVNMFTLYDVGQLCERLFGTRRYLTLYLLSGLLGSAASLWWNPMVNSVGASGALFGVLGATFVYMLDKRNGVPVSIMTAHATSMGVFIVYGVVNGLAKSGIDNAAHIGGLIGGAILGFALARPVGEARSPSPARAGIGVAICAIAIAGLAFMTPNSRGGYELERRFIEDLNAFAKEEDRLVAGMRGILAKARAPGVNEAELRPAIADIVSQWDGAHRRFTAYRLEPASRLLGLQQDMVAYTDTRHRAVTVLILVFDRPAEGKAQVQEFNRLMKEGDTIVERIKARRGKDPQGK